MIKTRTANWIAKSCWLSLARCIRNLEVPERVVLVVDLADRVAQRVVDRGGRKDKGMILSVWSSMRWSSMPIRMANSIGTNCSSLLGICHLLATKALGDVLVKREAVALAAREDRVVPAVVVEVGQVDLTGALRVVAHNGHNALSNLATRLQ